MLAVIYILSVLFFYLILRKDIKSTGYKPTVKNLYKYYKFDIIWTICPGINTFIVLLWTVIEIKNSFKCK